MLEAKINGRTGNFDIKAKGEVHEIMADITTLLEEIYNGLNNKDKVDFKRCVLTMAEEELYTLSGEEMQKKTEELERKTKKDLEELEELLKKVFRR